MAGFDFRFFVYSLHNLYNVGMSLILFLIIIAVFFAGIIAAIYLLLKKFSREPKNNDQAMLMLQNQIQDLRKNLDIRLGESTKMIQYHSTESQKVIRDITEKRSEEHTS